jgi:hypothetical protein
MTSSPIVLHTDGVSLDEVAMLGLTAIIGIGTFWFLTHQGKESDEPPPSLPPPRDRGPSD